jgi:hypothetical protein
LDFFWEEEGVNPSTKVAARKSSWQKGYCQSHRAKQKDNKKKKKKKKRGFRWDRSGFIQDFPAFKTVFLKF